MKLFFSALIVFFISIAGCALREDIYILDNRLALLEKKNAKAESINQQLSATVQDYSENSVNADSRFREQYAKLHAEFDQLKDEVRLLSGRCDEIEHLLNNRIKNFEKSSNNIKTGIDGLQEDMRLNKNRLSRFEEYLNSESELLSSPKKSKAPKQNADIEIYQKAKADFDEGNLKEAKEGFASLLKQYPKSDNADNAQFWIGEIYYQEKWFQKAILEYQKVIEKYPEGNKIKSAFLKQGFAFLNLGDTDNARLIFKKLIKKYPESNASRIAENKLKVF